jgi:hypothetical protein
MDFMWRCLACKSRKIFLLLVLLVGAAGCASSGQTNFRDRLPLHVVSDASVVHAPSDATCEIVYSDQAEGSLVGAVVLHGVEVLESRHTLVTVEPLGIEARPLIESLRLLPEAPDLTVLGRAGEPGLNWPGIDGCRVTIEADVVMHWGYPGVGSPEVDISLSPRRLEAIDPGRYEFTLTWTVPDDRCAHPEGVALHVLAQDGEGGPVRAKEGPLKVTTTVPDEGVHVDIDVDGGCINYRLEWASLDSRPIGRSR